MADGGKDNPAKKIRVGGGGAGTSIVEGGKGGDMGGGDDARTGECDSTALPLPLSTLGNSSSSPFSVTVSFAISDDTADATALR